MENSPAFTASLGSGALSELVAGQVGSLFPDDAVAATQLAPYVDHATQRLEHCCSRITQKYYGDSGRTHFDHRHTDQYAMFLYFLANSIHRLEGSPQMAARVYAVNKALHALDAYYEVELPDVFFFMHPVGTVLGRAQYADYLVVYQRVSVGSSVEGDSPVFGEGVVLFGGSTVVGRSTVGSNCWFSVGATVLDTDIPSDSTVFGVSPSLTIRPTKRDVVRDLFGHAP